MDIARRLGETTVTSPVYFPSSTKEQRIRSVNNLAKTPAVLGAQPRWTKAVFTLKITGDFVTGDVLEVNQVLKCYQLP